MGLQHEPEQQLLRYCDTKAGAKGHKGQGLTNGIGVFAAHAHLLADDHGGRRCHAEDGYRHHLIDVARHGVGGDQVCAARHVAHDDGVE